MPLYIDPRGKTTYGIGICSRCSRKMSLDDLFTDPNSFLKVCRDDLDLLDPWRLPPRQLEKMALRFARPDVPLNNTDLVFYLTTEDGFHLITEDGESILLETSGDPIP